MEIKILEKPFQQAKVIEQFIKQEALVKPNLKILEAGCGRMWRLELNDIKYELHGLDINKFALEKRKNIVKDLDKIILGDLRFVDLKKEEYDIIYSSYVLEHIQNAKMVVDNFAKWLKPGGLLILIIPDRNTVFGFLTRITPFWFHIMFKKYVKKNKNAGKLGFGPYPTFHEPIISRKGIHKYCKNSRFTIMAEYGHSFDLVGPGVAKLFIRLFAKSISILTFGSLPWKYGGLTFILKNKV